MKLPCNDKLRWERGIALILFTLALPVLLGLTILGVDLGNLYLTRDRLNSLNRAAAATAVNVRALHGWAPLACTGTDTSANKLGYKCGTAISQSAPKGDKYNELVTEIANTLTTQISNIFADAIITRNGTRSTNGLIEYGLPGDLSGTTWSTNIPSGNSPVYNLRDDKFQLRIRYASKTILLSKLASLLKINIASLCRQPDDPQMAAEKRCWVESTDTASNSSSTKARVILLLDTSGSMQSKQESLKSAAGTFIDYFNPFKDEVGIIPYGTGVKPGAFAPSAFNVAGSDNLLQIKNRIASLGVGGQTNPCDALIESAAMIPTNTSPTAATRTFVVLFTDGAPNVYRLRFCDPALSVGGCTTPSGLQSAPTNDWYGWTVKWGRRETYGSNANPFFDPPQIKGSDGSVTFDTSLVAGPPVKPGKFRINENGDFMIRNSTASSTWYQMESTQSPAPIAGMPYSKAFRNLSTKDDNYLWNGPSYLVNRKDQTSMSSVPNLIDRVDSTFTTCGIPKRKGGAIATDADNFNYNHSLYFASRVLDRNWNLTRTLFGSTTTQAGAVFLNPASVRPSPLAFATPPPDMTVKFYRGDGALESSSAPSFTPLPSSPAGCLDALDAEIPVARSGVQLFVGVGGSSFWSNTTAASIGQVGEIIKTAELPYYCAIRAADYLRSAEKNTTVFAVGLGEGARYTYGETCEDPMQNALDFDRRKDFFLQRLAFAPESINFGNGATTSLATAQWQSSADFGLRSRTLTNCTAAHPLAGQTVYLGFSSTCANWGSPPSSLAIPTALGACKNPVGREMKPPEFSTDSIGGYYPTSNPEQLKAQFGAIAKQILFRLSL